MKLKLTSPTLLLLAVLLEVLAFEASATSYHVKLYKAGTGARVRNRANSFGQNAQDGVCIILCDTQIKKYRGLKSKSELMIHSRPAVQAPAEPEEGRTLDEAVIVEIFGHDRDLIQGYIDTICLFVTKVEPLNSRSVNRAAGELDLMERQPEVIKIVDSGNSSNRIDVVFMGDGYTSSMRQQFIDDIQRLTKEMFEGPTFRSYLPLFNVWAIYDESVDAGIGYNGPQNTPFRLYREQGQLRVIWPGNPAYARQVCQLTGPGGCDYPSIIANDNFYGGLGGEFVISTKSARTGTIVLRHEMGHNFAQVGDEYDNSPTYYGVNSATALNNLGWAHWLTGARREERAMYRLLAYPWANLANGPQSFTFTSDGTYSRWYCLVSVSAAGEPDSLEFTLDGQILPWTSTGFDDREFYSWRGTQGFSSGSHTFTVRSKTPSTHPMIPRMIASINIHEYGSESEFEADNNHISAYPTWGEMPNRRKTLRPSNEGCLMRNITQAQFCSVCKEGMWYQFLSRVSLIDGVTLTPVSGGHNATVRTLQLGQLRPVENQIEGEKLSIRWALNGVDQFQYTDFFTVPNIPRGSWRVTVSLVTPEVRLDPTGLLTDSESFTVN